MTDDTANTAFDRGLGMRRARIEGGHTTQTAAAIFGCTPSAISHFESRPNLPRIDTLARYYVACNREDLAEPLLPLLEEDQLTTVNALKVRLHVLGPELRAKQGHGPHKSVRTDRRVARAVTRES